MSSNQERKYQKAHDLAKDLEIAAKKALKDKDYEKAMKLAVESQKQRNYSIKAYNEGKRDAGHKEAIKWIYLHIWKPAYYLANFNKKATATENQRKSKSHK